MAFTEFYVQTTGSNLNAGTTTSDVATLTYVSGNWDSTTNVFTVASGNPSSDGVTVGDFVSIYADGSTVTGFVGRVTAVDSTTITVSDTICSGTEPTNGTGNRTLKVGGAWKGPNSAEAFPFNFASGAMVNTSNETPRVNIKSGTNYNITASMAHAAGNSTAVIFQGYTSTINDGGIAVIDGGTSGTSYILLDISGTSDWTVLKDLTFQNNGATGSAAGVNIQLTSVNCSLINVTVHDVRGHGIVTAAGAMARLIDCEAYNCNQSNTASLAGLTIGDGLMVRCISRDNNRAGIRYNGTNGIGINILNCLSYGNTEDGLFSVNHRQPTFISGCIVYDNEGDGIDDTGSGAQADLIAIEDCILIDNGGYGINLNGAGAAGGYVLNRNAFYSNTSGEINPATAAGYYLFETDSITLTADPFEDAVNGDFNINNVAGGGALLRAVSLTL